MGKKALAILCNDNYINYAGTFLCSFVSSNSWFDGDVVVITDDKDFIFSDDSINILKKIYPNIKRHVAKSGQYADLREKFRPFAGRPSYLDCLYKYEIFNMSEYDNVLFLDCDMIVCDSIKELFDIKDWISFCHDGVEEDGSYGGLNAGFILLNNRARKDSFFNEMLDYARNIKLSGDFRGHEFGMLCEQDVLNRLFNDTANFLDKKYNSPNMGGTVVDVEKRTTAAKIIHYWAKPTNNFGAILELTYDRKIWRKYNNIFKAIIEGRDIRIPCSKTVTYCLFGKPGETIFDKNDIYGKFIIEGPNVLDFRKFNLENYSEYKDNENYFTTRSYYKMILPEIEKELKFGYHDDDFELVDYKSEDGKSDLSYFKPKVEREYVTDLENIPYKSGPFDWSICGISDDRRTYASNYHKMFIGSERCCHIFNEGPNNGKSIIVFGDNYMIPVIPILAYYYSEVVFLDNTLKTSHIDYFCGRLFDDSIIEFSDKDRNIIAEGLI